MAESKINVPVKFRTESEANIAKDTSKICVEGTITLSEKNLYLGLGNGEFYKYDGTDTDGMPIVATDIDSEENAKVLSKERNKPVLFFNSGVPSITQIQENGDVNSVSLFGEAITQEALDSELKTLRDALELKINLKPSVDEVFTKAEGADLLARAGNIETKIDNEVTRATTKENELNKKIDAKAKIVIYSTGVSLTPPDCVVHGETIYIVTKAFTTTGDFTADSANLRKAAPDIKVEIKTYKAGESFVVNELLLYQGTLYPVLTAFTATGTWDTDKVNVDETAKSVIFNPNDYYTSITIDELLAKKQDKLTPGSGVAILKDEASGTISVSADMDTAATADKIVQRDSKGVAYANNNANLADTELINNKTLNSVKQELTKEINRVEDKFIGTSEESFSIAETLQAPSKMGTQTVPCKVINITPSDVSFTCETENWNQLLKLTLETKNDSSGSGTLTMQWLNNPSDTGWIEKFVDTQINGKTYKVLKVTATKGGNKLVDLYFNAPNSTELVASSADYSGARYLTYTVVIDMGKAKAKAAPTFEAKANTTEELAFSDWQSWTRTDGCCYYEDDAVGKNYKEVMDFIGAIPVCLSNGSIVEYLNPNNYAQQKDGTASSYKTLGRDVMVMFPKRGLRFKWEGSLLKVSITNQEDAEGFTYNAFNRAGVIKDRFYYSAYEGYVDSNMLYSSSGRTPRVNTNLTQFRVYARARNDAANGITGYQLPSYYMIMYLQACYLMVHKSLNSQATVGYGCSYARAINTGGSDTWGMNMELLTKADVKRTNQTSNMKVLGIEDFWGNAWDWIDGCYIDKNGEVRLSTDPDNYNDTGMGYANGIQTGMFYNNTSNTEVGYISCVQGTNELGFFPSNTSDGAEGAYFCDKYWQLYYRCLAFGGSWGNGADAGAFCLNADNVASTTYTHIACRLAYL